MRIVTFFVIATTLLELRNADVCRTPNNETAQCISLYDCPILLNTVCTTYDPTVRVFLRMSHCGCTSAEPMVCCGSYSNFISVKKTPEPDTSLFEVKVKRLGQSTETYLASRKICGLQHSDDLGYNHSVNGTLLTEYPWLALIGYKSSYDSNLRFLCAGSLINKKFVLTAAVCVYFEDVGSPESVRLGEHNTKTETDCLQDERVYECSDSIQDFGVDHGIAHPNYSRFTGIHNIGLIKINGTVEYSDYIRPICLPIVGLTAGGESEEELIMSGWKNGGGQKKKSSSRLITYDTCIALLETLPLKNTSHACGLFTSNDGDDVACNYYLGSPVMYSYKLQWTQEGVFLFGGCSPKDPYVYTKVVYYIDWIQETLKP